MERAATPKQQPSRRTDWNRIAVSLLVVAVSVKPATDLDLGWHLRYGDYFFQNRRVLKDNTISYVWPNYQWIQASWGYDPLVSALFHGSGFFGISIAGAILTLCIFSLCTWSLPRGSPWLLPLAIVFLSQTPPLYASGMRTQTPSALIFTLTLIISMQLLSFSSFALRSYPLSLISLPLLFLLWTNLHGGFTLGLMLLTMMWILHGVVRRGGASGSSTLRVSDSNEDPAERPHPERVFESKGRTSGGAQRRDRTPEKNSRTRWMQVGIALALSWMVTALNPWGLRIWEETVKHSTNPNLTGIMEWTPLLRYPGDAALTGLVALVIAAVAVVRRKFRKDLPFLISVSVVTVLTFQALRFIILFGIMATMYLSRSLSSPSTTLVARRWRFVHYGLIGLVFIDMLITKRFFYISPAAFDSRFSWSTYCEQLDGTCSESITERMLQDPPRGNGLHPYDYGGYLSYRVPMVKTFLDGRMAAWERNGETPPIRDADLVFREQNPIAFRRLDANYNFQWAVVPANAPLIRYLDRLTEAGQWEKRVQDRWYAYYVKRTP